MTFCVTAVEIAQIELLLEGYVWDSDLQWQDTANKQRYLELIKLSMLSNLQDPGCMPVQIWDFRTLQKLS